ncbi:MAG: hypothetical protein ABI461_20675 [Polyangiaceae bacterium]
MSSTWTLRATKLAPFVSVPFGFGAVHHLLAVASPDVADPSSPARHLVFVGVNALFAGLFGLRVKYTLFPAILLAIQQTYSHGSAFLEARAHGAFDSESLAVLLFLPVVLVVAGALFRKPI